jgi:hypothetical protein
LIQTGAQPDSFLDLVEKAHLLSRRRLVDFDDQQPETVGSEVDGRQLASRER